MRFRVPFAALGLAACATAPSVDGVVVDGLWAFELSAGEPDGELTCVENYLEASCQEVGTVQPVNDVELTAESSATPSSFFAEVLGTSDGRFLLVLDGLILEGDVEGEDGRTITFAWSGEDGFDQEVTRDEVLQAGITESRTSTVEVSFVLDEDGLASGSMSQTLSVSRTLRQIDEVSEPLPNFELFMELSNLLEDDVDDDADDGRANFADEDDCDGDICEISGTESGSVSGTFTGVRVARENAWPGAGGYGEPANPSGALDDFLPIFEANGMD